MDDVRFLTIGLYAGISIATAFGAAGQVESWGSDPRRQIWAVVVLTCWAWPLWALYALGKFVWEMIEIARGR